MAAKPKQPLEKYGAKRDFKKTPEPGPKVPRRKGNSFVIQEHHARRHHFDLRLEIDGVLVSWAVPKGIPDDLVAKHLAVHVEDHPLEYGKFEGVIPKGNYGAGTVAIWDKGQWEPLEKSWRQTFAKGTLKFHLVGDRLNGAYLLARMKEEPNWMLKMLNPATHVAPLAKTEPENARYVSPQLARVVPTVPSGSEWLHELKYDGYRLIIVKRAGELQVFTRNGLDWTHRFKRLAQELNKVSKNDFVLDGEAVVFDEKGRTNFGDLQASLESGKNKGGGDNIAFIAFDLLHFDGQNLRELTLRERLARLAKLVPAERGIVMRSKIWDAEFGEELFKQACKNQLEGIISKTATGRYVEGARKDWVKSKCRPRQEFIICGYLPPKSSLPGFSSLVLGSFENGRMVPRGKVGTGFTESGRLKLLERLKKLATDVCPFSEKEKDVNWLKPRLVAEVEFTEITRDGSIRQGSFIALREDKAAAEVHLDGLQSAKANVKDATVAGIKVSNPGRLVYPGEQITKLEVVSYFDRVGDLMLPYVSNRPLALIRAPEGITGEQFFQKTFTTHVPPDVHQTQLADGSTVFYVKNKKGLVALAQFGGIEIHPWGSSLKNVDNADYITWDLDPDAEVPWKEILGAALLIRDFLAERNLETVVKTSGGKGLHICMRVKPTHPWDVIKAFTKGVAGAVANFNKRRFVITSTKAKRTGKIYIDWMRNGRGATCIAPWGLRARPGATISMPINWGQLPEIASAGFTIHQPPEDPEEWANHRPQSISTAHLKEFLAVL